MFGRLMIEPVVQVDPTIDLQTAVATLIKVTENVDKWYGSSDMFFKVRADDGNLYILRRETSTPDGPWHLESFRQLKHES